MSCRWKRETPGCEGGRQRGEGGVCSSDRFSIFSGCASCVGFSPISGCFGDFAIKRQYNTHNCKCQMLF